MVQKQFGVSLKKLDFLVDILLICFQAMKESGLTWPFITEDEQDRQMGRIVKDLLKSDQRLEIADKTVRGRIEWDASKDERMPVLVIDGREISWAVHSVTA